MDCKSIHLWVTRIAAELRHANGANLIFIGTTKRKRSDGLTNTHRMFLNLRSGKAPYFKEVHGPWVKQHYTALCAVAADINGDGIDDLIVCKKKGFPHMYLQNRKGQFTRVPKHQYIGKKSHVGYWRNARVGRLTNDSMPDLITVEGRGAGPHYLHIFKGKKTPPYFSFENPYQIMKLPHASLDLELLDVNKDGIKDIYVSQANEKRGYCAADKGKNILSFIPNRGKGGMPPPNWLPPKDKALDLLLVGRMRKEELSFKKVKMKAFRGRGCVGLTRKFGSNSQSLIVAEGRAIHNGYNYLLEWGPLPPTKPPSKTQAPTSMVPSTPSPETTMAPSYISLSTAEPTTFVPINASNASSLAPFTPSPTTTMAPTDVFLTTAEPTTLVPMNSSNTSIVASTKENNKIDMNALEGLFLSSNAGSSTTSVVDKTTAVDSVSTLNNINRNSRMLKRSKFQPRVMRVEKGRARRVIGSLSKRKSPWCGGKPTFW